MDIDNKTKFMKVTTKYSLEDMVWYMSQNRPQCGKVTYVYVRVTGKDQFSISYHLNHESTNWEETRLFGSKKELLDTVAMEKIFERVPGDKIWVMHDNRAVFGTIESIFFCEGISCVDFESRCGNEEYKVTVSDGRTQDFKPEDMFTTKAELIDYLSSLRC